MKRVKTFRPDKKAIRKVRQLFTRAAREGKLRPVAYQDGEPIGWVGDAGADDCPCCEFMAQQEETRHKGARAHLCSRCGQTIWLFPEETRGRKKRVCYRCFMRMRPRSPDPPGLVH